MKANWMGRIALLAAASLCLSAPATARDPLLDMLSGQSAMKGKKLAKAIEKAGAHPLGSQENPVRAAMPEGQRAYLASLRCTDGQPPQFQRIGNFGLGVFGNIVDGYAVRCDGGTPAEAKIFMDMYHRGYVETRPVPGFTIGAE